jgi:hypothetical protein
MKKQGAHSASISHIKTTCLPKTDQATNNPVWKLNGISILAVDSNELSLTFLKMMTANGTSNFTRHQTVMRLYNS